MTRLTGDRDAEVSCREASKNTSLAKRALRRTLITYFPQALAHFSAESHESNRRPRFGHFDGSIPSHSKQLPVTSLQQVKG